MSDEKREYEEILKQLEKAYPLRSDNGRQNQSQEQYSAERPVSKRTPYSGRFTSPQNKSAQQNRTPQKSGHFLNRQTAGKRKKRQRIIVCVSVLAFVLLIAAVAVICKSCFGSKGNLAVLQGDWRYDQYTEYEFDGKGSGCMCIEETNHYEFTYTIDGDTLKIDFALDYVTDCEYDFKLENDKLTLIGGKGTVNPGQEYNLERVQ